MCSNLKPCQRWGWFGHADRTAPCFGPFDPVLSEAEGRTQTDVSPRSQLGFFGFFSGFPPHSTSADQLATIGYAEAGHCGLPTGSHWEGIAGPGGGNE